MKYKISVVIYAVVFGLVGSAGAYTMDLLMKHSEVAGYTASGQIAVYDTDDAPAVLNWLTEFQDTIGNITDMGLGKDKMYSEIGSDNISESVSVVTEPRTLLLLGTGIAGLAAVGRRKRK